jgi:hypothetical protein
MKPQEVEIMPRFASYRLAALGHKQPLKSLAGERLVMAKSGHWNTVQLGGTRSALLSGSKPRVL